MTTDNHQGYARESIHGDVHPITAQCKCSAYQVRSEPNG